MNNPQQPLEYDAVLGGENQISSSHHLKMTTERTANLLKAGDLGIRLWNQFRKQETYIPSLTGINFSGKNLHYANFSNANLQCVNLNNAYVHYANFSNADFQGVDLSSADELT